MRRKKGGRAWGGGEGGAAGREDEEKEEVRKSYKKVTQKYYFLINEECLLASAFPPGRYKSLIMKTTLFFLFLSSLPFPFFPLFNWLCGEVAAPESHLCVRLRLILMSRMMTMMLMISRAVVKGGGRGEGELRCYR